jgi:hypothetical protein
MQDSYITSGVDEQKTLDEARDKTAGDWYEHPVEAIMIHYHSARVPCEAKDRHRIFKDGHEQSVAGEGNGAGPA